MLSFFVGLVLGGVLGGLMSGVVVGGLSWLRRKGEDAVRKGRGMFEIDSDVELPVICMLLAATWVDDFQNAHNESPQTTMDLQNKAKLVVDVAKPLMEVALMAQGVDLNAAEDD